MEQVVTYFVICKKVDTLHIIEKQIKALTIGENHGLGINQGIDCKRKLCDWSQSCNSQYKNSLLSSCFVDAGQVVEPCKALISSLFSFVSHNITILKMVSKN